MSELNIAAYSGDDSLGLSANGWHIERTAKSYWSTILLGMFHINTKEGDTIHFNNTPLIDKGKLVADLADWQKRLNKLRQYSIKNVYVSIGGDSDLIRDFRNISNVYHSNNKSFDNTPLKSNLILLKQALPIINGVDMDNEECEDDESFYAFCKLVHELGWDISFCAYGYRDSHGWTSQLFYFWIRALTAVEESDWGQGAVKWLYLQMYAEAMSPIEVWLEEIKKALPNFATDGFIIPGLFARYYDPKSGTYQRDCPSGVKASIISWRNNSAVRASIGGAFIWNLDYVWQTTFNPHACIDSGAGMSDYTSAIVEAIQGP